MKDTMLNNAIVCPYCNNELFVVKQKSKDKHIIVCAQCYRKPYKAHQIRRYI